MVPFWARFLAVAAAQPERPALRSGGTVVCYGELQQRAAALAAALAAAGVESGELVGLYLDKSIEYVVAVLGCWAAGVALVPLEPRLPAARLRLLGRDARLRLLVGRPEHRGALPELRWLSLPGNPGPPLSAESAERPAARGIDPAQHPAYVIYTSGSTGAPKGVLVGHGGIVNLLDAQIAAFGLTPASRSLLYLSISFDASLSAIGTALLAGACLGIEPGIESLTPAAQVRWLRELGITHLDLPPALLRVLDPDSLPPTLSTLIIGGEVCPPEVVRRHAARRRVINVYGPTEATICVSLGACDAQRWAEPLLGRPIAGVRFQVAAADGSAVPPGTPGELWISGAALALGYLHQPVLTAQRFVVHDGVRWYRTGDLVVAQPDGELVYRGRLDRQLKLHGRLVAPEELEAALLRQPGVQRAAVLRREEIPGRPQLVAYLAGEALGDPEALRACLIAELPAWLVPQRLVVLSVLPETASGKVDVTALAALATPPPSSALATGPSPVSRSGEESLQAAAELLRGLWARVLAVPVGLDDDFATLGGDSLASLEVAAGAEALGLALTPELLWIHRTPRAVATALLAGTVQVRSDAELRADATSLLLGAPPEALGAEPAAVHPEGDQILLTGVTGHLGPHLLKALLGDGVRRVFCLVRAADPAQATARLRAALLRCEIDLAEADWDRVQLLPGDVTRPQLGQSATDWAALSTAVTEVHHLAANVNGALPYAALRPANLLGTREVLRLCQSGRRKRLHHASTLSVILQATTASEPGGVSGIHGGYAQSKAAAEALLQAAASPLTWCHRLGLLTGASRRPTPGAADPLATFLCGLAALGCVPAGLQEELRLDVTPVDWAAQVVVALRRAAPGTYAVAAPYRGVSLGALLAAFSAHGVAVNVVSLAEFHSRIPALRHRAELSACLSLLAALPGPTAPAGRPGAIFLPPPPLLTELPIAVPSLPPLDVLLARYVDAALHGTGSSTLH